MLDLDEPLHWLTADTLGGRVGRHPFRVRCFDGLQLAHQQVVFPIANQRIVEHIVAIVVMANLFGQALHVRSFVR